MVDPAARRRGFLPGPRPAPNPRDAHGFNPALGKNTSITGGGGFNPGAAGSKSYGMGRAAPNMGKTPNKAGYGKRDATNRARENALQSRLKGF